MDMNNTPLDLLHSMCKLRLLQHSDRCWLCAQMLFSRTAEDRAKIDLKLHFMRKTLNEVVRSLPLDMRLDCTWFIGHILRRLCCSEC